MKSGAEIDAVTQGVAKASLDSYLRRRGRRDVGARLKFQPLGSNRPQRRPRCDNVEHETGKHPSSGFKIAAFCKPLCNQVSLRSIIRLAA